MVKYHKKNFSKKLRLCHFNFYHMILQTEKKNIERRNINKLKAFYT